MWLPKSYRSRLREIQVETEIEKEIRETRPMEVVCTGFGMQYGKLRAGLGVRVGESILRAGKPPYIEVEGFPFWSWALGRLPYLQIGTSHGRSGLGPGVGVVRVVKASPPSSKGQTPYVSARKDTDMIILPTNCDSPMFRSRRDLSARNSMFEL